LYFSHNSLTKLPDSFLNVGIGIGGNYKLAGTKTVVGLKNSGLMVGLGSGQSLFISQVLLLCPALIIGP
jgi:sulfopyruvate decarboxylase TPP-binding subunit